MTSEDTPGQPQVIRASNGEELVVLTRSAYDKLVAAAADLDDEEAADIAVARAAKAEWEASGRPAIPLRVLRCVRAGDTYLKALRVERGFTQAQLATMAGLSPRYLSEIETSRRTPDETARKALAKALDVHPIWLSEGAPEPPRDLRRAP